MPRPAGTPNKNKKALILLLQAKYPGYHPVMEMAAIAHDMNNSIEMRANMHKEVASYIEPKRKAVEVTGSDGNELTVKVMKYTPEARTL